MRRASRPPLGRPLILTIAILLAASCSTAAQDRLPAQRDLLSEPVLSRDFSIRWEPQASQLSSVARPAPLRLFSMPTAIPQSPFGLDADDDLVDPNEAFPAPDDGRIQVTVGMDNPFFDFRRRGDPGGVGYYKIYSQALLWDTHSTVFSVGLQAMTPAGLDANGIATGPTHICPNFAWLYDIGNGAAVHGFVGQNLRTGAHWDDHLVRALKYGFALQGPTLGPGCDHNRGVHLFVEALGRYRYEGIDTPQRPIHNWEILPGVEWRLNQNWWLTGGYLFPMTDSAADGHRVQINCMFRF